MVTVMAGTGKWAALAGAKTQVKTRHSMDGASIYDFSPENKRAIYHNHLEFICLCGHVGKVAVKKLVLKYGIDTTVEAV